MATNQAAEAETSRDTAEGDAFLVEWGGEQMYALACVKRGRVRFRTAQNAVLPSDAKVVSQLAQTTDSTEATSDAAVVEWKGERFHALAFIKHGKQFYRLADGRSLGRATFVAGLVDPDVVEQRIDIAGKEGDWTAVPVADSAPELPLPHGTAQQPASTGHWSDAIVDEPTSASPTAERPTAPAAAEHPSTPESSPERAQAPASPETPPTSVQFDGQRWHGIAADGTTVTVWEGLARLAEVDNELAAAEQRVQHLTELRRLIDGDREAAIAEHVARFAKVDGIRDLADATDAQRTMWRRYAEGVVGD